MLFRSKQEEILWKQKSRVQWLKERERNTSFFHKSMIQRRQHNIIFSLKDQNGNRLFNHEDMEKELVDHFKNLLTELEPNRTEAIEKITQHIPHVITKD